MPAFIMLSDDSPLHLVRVFKPVQPCHLQWNLHQDWVAVREALDREMMRLVPTLALVDASDLSIVDLTSSRQPAVRRVEYAGDA